MLKQMQPRTELLNDLSRFHHRHKCSYNCKTLPIKPLLYFFSLTSLCDICAIPLLVHPTTRTQPQISAFKHLVSIIIERNAIYVVHKRMFASLPTPFCLDTKREKKSGCPELVGLLTLCRK